MVGSAEREATLDGTCHHPHLLRPWSSAEHLPGHLECSKGTSTVTAPPSTSVVTPPPYLICTFLRFGRPEKPFPGNAM